MDNCIQENLNRTWEVYGLSFSSPCGFISPLLSGNTSPEFTYDIFCGVAAWTASQWESSRLLARSPGSPENRVEVRQWQDEVWIKFEQTACFIIRPKEIVCFIEIDDLRAVAEIDFLDAVIPMYMEMAGTPVLHASAVEVDGNAVIFTSSTGGGKSILAGGLAKRGAGFITDDVAAFTRFSSTYHIFPGYPQLRLWPDAAECLFGNRHHECIDQDWQKHRSFVNDWAEFRGASCPVGAVYILEKQETANDRVSIRPLKGHKKIITCLQNSPAFSALDIQAKADRIDFFAGLMSRIPVKQLSFPKDFERFEDVLDEIERDVRQGRA